MVALIVLLLILAIFGGLGFAAHILWIVLIAAVILWLLGFLIGGAEHGMGRRRWYGRWYLMAEWPAGTRSLARRRLSSSSACFAGELA